jgi:hypothetical protein
MLRGENPSAESGITRNPPLRNSGTVFRGVDADQRLVVARLLSA